LGRHFVFRLGYTGGWVGGRSLFRNELFQLGGFALLRGFDEQSIYASSYHIATLEPRIMLSDVSFAYLFTDLALIDSPPLRGSTPGTYTGFGIGTTLTTRSGLLNVSLALGSPPLGTVSFRQARIHFGYQTLF
jgi:hemolysin activation/secretion protein